MLCGLVLRDLEKSVAGPDVDGLGPRIATKWIWKSQCNEREGRERANGQGSAKDVFGVRAHARSLAAAFWKMDRVTLRPRRHCRRRFLFARAVSGFFLSEVNFPFGSSIFGAPFLRRHISTVR